MEEKIKVTQIIKDLIERSWDAIKQRRVLEFPFVSKSGNVGSREIKPYMVYINDKKEIKVVGLPRPLWDCLINKRHPGQYLLEKIDLNQMKVLSKTFIDPGVPKNIVVSTKKVKIICRFFYNNQVFQEAASNWLKIEGLDLI
ncbi:hypothetical protein [Segetibacter aerophilus]|uniref:Uncharacterized protein n=1 Tax=Segetibacter aerophilus TaxID=670293 RepID=A0A512BEM4_9BACT|nr:hypothetical protein [Segetibacter aerophilus]GEO10420.1 hypothetical protein SAE01_29160 [Segetibacter aerophilus]